MDPARDLLPRHGAPVPGRDHALDHARTSPYNPINVDPPDRTLTIHTPGQWEIFGLQALQSFQSAYPTIVDVSAEDAALVRQDIEETGRRAGTMGGALVSIGWMVAIIIVGVAVASAIRKGLSAFLLYMGVDIEFKDALIERFEEELDSCLSGNEAACARADATASDDSGQGARSAN
ncbi:MAG: hypothetical protein ACYTG0_12650 [Planctomycetota bacterium]